jgi:NitT/TauT family transport system substrate-binding protein
MNQFIVFFVVLIVLLSGTGCKKTNPPTVTKVVLAEGMQPICSPVYIAAEKGYFQEQGLNVRLVPFSSGKLCLDTLLGGKANIATVAETPLMHLGFQENSAAVLCTMHFATKNTKCIARKDKGIEKPEDLKGHKVGVPVGTNAEYFMGKFLEKYGLTRKDVKVVNLNPPEMVGALVRGDIDASFSWEPHNTRSVNQLGDKAIVFLGEDLYRETYNIVSLRDWADDNPETCRRLLRALIKATSFIHNNKDESVRIVADHIQMEPEELASIWHYYTFEIVLDRFLLESLVGQSKWAIASGTHVGDVPEYSHMIYPQPLKALDPKAVDIELSKER